ncbi:MAG: hypothetical protein K2M56_03360 [Muribaculaceae bacterium]|nr:hypothetical protein [Muribaculaceae bacterium]
MNATISMDGLWMIVDSLSAKNKKWLVDRLLKSLSTSKESKEDAILAGIAQSAQEAKEGNVLPIDTLWNQI